MKSRIFSASDIKSSSRGQLWIPGFILTAGFLAFPVCLLMSMGIFSEEINQFVEPSYLYVFIWKNRVLPAGMITAVGSGILNGFSGFWYLYSRQKVDYYHSLPIKRRDMFWHRAFLGILYYMVPCMAMLFLAVCIGAAKGFASPGFLAVAGCVLALNFLVYLMVYFLMVLLISITGNLLAGVLFTGAAFVYGPLLSMLISVYQAAFFQNANTVKYGATELLYKYTSPAALAWQLVKGYEDGSFAKTAVLCLLLTALLSLAACTAFVKRPSEAAGQTIVYRGIEILVRLMVLVPASLGSGILFMRTVSEGRLLWWIFGMLFGAVLSHGVMGMIIKMNYRGFVSGKWEFLAGCLLTVLCAVSVQKDFFGFDTYIPAYEELEAIGFGVSGSVFDTLSGRELKQTADGRYFYEHTEDSEAMAEFQEVAVTPEIYGILESSLHAGKQEEPAYGSCSVKYLCKSGKAVYRSYVMSEEKIRKILIATRSQKGLLKREISALDIEEQYLQSIAGIFTDCGEYTLFPDNTKKRRALLEAVRTDYMEAEPEEFLETPCARLDFTYEQIPMAETYNGMPVKGTGLREGYLATVYVYPGFTRTVALLEETGHVLSMEDVEIERVELEYYGQEGVYEETIEDSAQIEELKSCLVPGVLSADYLDVCENLDVRVVYQGTHWQFHWLRKDRLPSFLKEKFAELKV